MITVRPSGERGVANLGWLDSRHTFSFGHYFDPQQMGFGPLRVINEDRVRPGAGFDTHGHRDMEIISYVLEGALEHKDSIGTGSVIRPGDLQVMSAGSGIRHSEFNHSKQEPVHFLQIWVLPDREGISPRYDQKTFSEFEKRGRLRLIGSPDGREGSIVIHQDVEISRCRGRRHARARRRSQRLGAGGPRSRRGQRHAGARGRWRGTGGRGNARGHVPRRRLRVPRVRSAAAITRPARNHDNCRQDFARALKLVRGDALHPSRASFEQ